MNKIYAAFVSCKSDERMVKKARKIFDLEMFFSNDFENLYRTIGKYDGIIIFQPFDLRSKILKYRAKRKGKKTVLMPHGAPTKNKITADSIRYVLGSFVNLMKYPEWPFVLLEILGTRIFGYFFTTRTYDVLATSYWFLTPLYRTKKVIILDDELVNVEKNRKVLVVLQPFVEDKIMKMNEYVEYINDIIDVLRQLDISATIRFHPRNSETFRENISRISASDVKISKESDVVNDITKHYIVIGSFSTVLLDAAKNGNMTIIYDPDNRFSKYMEFGFEKIRIAHSKKELYIILSSMNAE